MPRGNACADRDNLSQCSVKLTQGDTGETLDSEHNLQALLLVQLFQASSSCQTKYPFELDRHTCKIALAKHEGVAVLCSLNINAGVLAIMELQCLQKTQGMLRKSRNDTCP